MAQRGTKVRHFRAPDDLWDKARETAEQHGDDLSSVLREALELYIKWAGRTPPPTE